MKIKQEDRIKLDRSEKKFELLFENSPIGMAMVSHATGDFLEVNKSLLASTGYTKEEFLALSYWDITPKEYEEQENQQIEDLNKHGRFGPNEKEYIRKDGSRYPIRISGFMLEDTNGDLVVWGLIEDISERKKFEQELRHMATHDELTGLANRRLFTERIAYTCHLSQRNKTKFGVIVLDLDKFKKINDEFGHSFGDKILQVFSQRVLTIMKRKTDVFARTGGDEFMLLLSSIQSAQDIDEIVEKIMNVLKERFEIDGRSVDMTVSAGSACYPDDGVDIEQLINRADLSAYYVKRNGGNSYKKWDESVSV